MSNPVPAVDESAQNIEIPRVLAMPMSIVLKEEREKYERSTKIPDWWMEHVNNHLFSGSEANWPKPHSFIAVSLYIAALFVAHHLYPLRTERLAFIHLIISFIVTFLYLDGRDMPATSTLGWMIKRIAFLPSALYLSTKEFVAWILWRRSGKFWNVEKNPWDARKAIASLMDAAQVSAEVSSRYYNVTHRVIETYQANIEAIEASAEITEKGAVLARQTGKLLTATNYEEMARGQRAQAAKLRSCVENQKAYTSYLDSCAEQFQVVAKQYSKLQLDHLNTIRGGYHFSENDLLTLEENMEPLRISLERQYIHIMTTLHDAQLNKPAPTLDEKAEGHSASASTN